MSGVTPQGRVLLCTRCTTPIEVFGGHWIDPKLYICGECKTGGITQQLDLLEQPPPPQEHEPPYDPHTSLIPY